MLLYLSYISFQEAIILNIPLKILIAILKSIHLMSVPPKEYNKR